MASSPITAWQIEGEKVQVLTYFVFLAPKSLWTVTAAMKSQTTASWQESHNKPRQRHHSANKGPYSQGHGLPHFIIGDWNAKVGSQEIPGITGKFGLGI